MRLRADQADLWGGLLLAGICFYFLVGATAYPTGTLRRMGPGYLPMVYSGAGLALGLAIAISSLGRSGKLTGWNIREAGAVLGAVALFSVMLPRFGHVPTSLVVVSLACLAAPRIRPLEVAVLAVGVTAVTWFVFLRLLQLPIPAMRWP